MTYLYLVLGSLPGCCVCLVLYFMAGKKSYRQQWELLCCWVVVVVVVDAAAAGCRCGLRVILLCDGVHRCSLVLR